MAICNLSAEYFYPSYVEYVYSLRCPISYDIFYVGKTRDLKMRLSQHISSSLSEKGYNYHKSMKIREIVKMGLVPMMRVIDTTEVRTRMDSHLASYKELVWIFRYHQMGWKLTNGVNVNEDAQSRSDYMYHQRVFRTKGTLPCSLFYFGRNKNNEDIYDLNNVDKYNSILPQFRKEYNPYNNPIWMKKMGLSV